MRSQSRASLFFLLAACCACTLVYFVNPTEHTLIPCLFHKVTGFECAGCGLTRATHFLLHADWARAWHYNPLVFVVLPAAVYTFFQKILYQHRDIRLPKLSDSRWLPVVSFTFVVAYMIVRNTGLVSF